MTAEDLSRRWAAIQRKLTEEIKPEALRKALCKPWVAAAVGIAVGTAVGFLFARRAVRHTQPETGHAPAPSTQLQGSTHGTGLLNILAVSALELGTRTLLARLPRDPAVKLTEARR